MMSNAIRLMTVMSTVYVLDVNCQLCIDEHVDILGERRRNQCDCADLLSQKVSLKDCELIVKQLL